MYALVDCNNFFASCEKIFNPSLEGKPVVILSNNDGCIIARSNEAKDLDIPMGGAYFQYKQIIEKNKVHVFSSNYELYGDISNRVMSIISMLAKDYEIYSIDEAFISLEDIPSKDLSGYIHNIQATIWQWVGVKVSIGVGTSKTLAKVANFVAKKNPFLCSSENIFDIRDEAVCNIVLSKLKLKDIWGISYALEAKLKAIGITTALGLRDSDTKVLRNSFGVTIEKVILELRGISCISLCKNAEAKQNIIASRSFGKNVTRLCELEEAISSYVSRACLRLRNQGSKASGIHIFLKASQQPCLHANKYTKSMRFTQPSSDTSYIIGEAKYLLKQIYHEGLVYKKAGIILIECIPLSYTQYSIFDSASNLEPNKSDLVMSLIDKSNRKFGKGVLFLAAEGTNVTRTDWKMKRNLKSPCYTTNWQELPKVK